MFSWRRRRCRRRFVCLCVVCVFVLTTWLWCCRSALSVPPSLGVDAGAVCGGKRWGPYGEEDVSPLAEASLPLMLQYCINTAETSLGFCLLSLHVAFPFDRRGSGGCANLRGCAGACNNACWLLLYLPCFIFLFFSFLNVVAPSVSLSVSLSVARAVVLVVIFYHSVF